MRLDDHHLTQQLLPTQNLRPDPEKKLKPAAVLLPLYTHRGEDWILLTQRTDSLREHRGQISFPGGKFDAEDRCLKSTALRESWEEVGLQPRDVKVLGMLDLFPTFNHYLIYPFVGRMPWPYSLKPNPAEIAQLIHVPLKALMAPDKPRVDSREYRGKVYPLYFYEHQEHTIWGITGHILHNFLNLFRSPPCTSQPH